MKSVSEYIREMLYWHDCLIIPGLGGLVANYAPAHIDKKRNLMLPPRKELVFNRNLSHNDGMLANYIAQAEKISFSDANALIDEFVCTIKTALQKQQPYLMGSVGVLRTNAGGIITFAADNNENYLTSSYGFGNMQIDNIELNKIPSIGILGVRRIAITAAAMTGLLLLSQETKIGTTDMQMLSQAGYTDMFSTPKSNVDATKIISPSSIAPATANTNSKFYLISGSFATDTEADTYISEMLDKGINGLEKLQSANRVRVTIAHFDNREDANKQMRQCRKIKGFENVWVLRQTN